MSGHLSGVVHLKFPESHAAVNNATKLLSLSDKTWQRTRTSIAEDEDEHCRGRGRGLQRVASTFLDADINAIQVTKRINVNSRNRTLILSGRTKNKEDGQGIVSRSILN